MKLPGPRLLLVFFLVIIAPACSASFEAELEVLTQERKILVTAFRNGDITYEQYKDRERLLLEKIEGFNSAYEVEMREMIAHAAQLALERAIKPIGELPNLDNFVLKTRLTPELSFDESIAIPGPYPVTTKLAIERMQRDPISFCSSVLARALLPDTYNKEVRGAPIMMGHLDNNNYQAFVQGKSMLYRITLSVNENGKWMADSIYLYLVKQKKK
jgi:hypothetical protein